MTREILERPAFLFAGLKSAMYLNLIIIMAERKLRHMKSENTKEKASYSRKRISQLPEEYLIRMKRLFGDRYEDFAASYEKDAVKGLRFNMLKARRDTIEKLVREWNMSPVPWCESGYTYKEEQDAGVIRPGKSPYHAAGVFYIQEPSAMITAEKADIRPGDTVLDLCAAPGGKTTQAAQKARFLLSNEIIKDRARILGSNVERMGLSNVTVCSAESGRLSEIFPEYFDKIIVDAPCSGEGMMRRDDTAVREWSPENVRLCIKRQREILENAVKMLKPSGRIVYSTCTFEPEENILQAESLCGDHENLSLVEAKSLYPHEVCGEGHFCAVIEKKGSPLCCSMTKEEIKADISARLKKGRIHVLREGVLPGEYISGKHKGAVRYVPSHAEILARKPEELLRDSINLKSEDAALRYLKGESIRLSELDENDYELMPTENGSFIAVCYDGYAMGAGKYVGGVIKNHYPKGLRQV